MSEATLRLAEQSRCDAIVAGRLDALAALIGDDLIHIHSVGYIDDKAGYLAGLRDRLDVRAIERDPPVIRISGDVAVMTGILTNIVSLRGQDEWKAGRSFVTQLWRRHDSGWVMFHYQATRMRADTDR